MTPTPRIEYGDAASIRDLERASILDFVQSCSEVFSGRVLDFGCGRQPYREIVEAAGAEYVPYDRPDFRGSHVLVSVGPSPRIDEIVCNNVDAILCTQVAQEIAAASLGFFFSKLRRLIRPGGHLVITTSLCWEDYGDLTRLTAAGLRLLLDASGFETLRLEQRAIVDVGGFQFCLGHGALARRPV